MPDVGLLCGRGAEGGINGFFGGRLQAGGRPGGEDLTDLYLGK